MFIIMLSLFLFFSQLQSMMMNSSRAHVLHGQKEKREKAFFEKVPLPNPVVLGGCVTQRVRQLCTPKS